MLTSSWRLDAQEKSKLLDALIACGIDESVLGEQTPVFEAETPAEQRCGEILAWVESKGAGRRWVALDHFPLATTDERLVGHHIETSLAEGLTHAGITEAIAILGTLGRSADEVCGNSLDTSSPAHLKNEVCCEMM